MATVSHAFGFGLGTYVFCGVLYELLLAGVRAEIVGFTPVFQSRRSLFLFYLHSADRVLGFSKHLLTPLKALSLSGRGKILSFLSLGCKELLSL